MRPLNTNSRVAPNRSHGTIRRKVPWGVTSRMRAPSTPPITPVMIRGGSRRRASGVKAFRYATVLATVPGQTAAVLVALAAMGAIPVKSRAGNDTKLPPPATELMVPVGRSA